MKAEPNGNMSFTHFADNSCSTSSHNNVRASFVGITRILFFLLFACLSIAATASAETYKLPWNVTNSRSDNLTKATHTFIVDGVISERYVRWWVGSTFIREDHSYYLNGWWDPTLDLDFSSSSGTYYVYGDEYTGSGGNGYVATHTWICTVDTQGPYAPTPDLSSSSDSGYSDTDNITNDSTPSFTWNEPSDRFGGEVAQYRYEVGDSTPDAFTTTARSITYPSLVSGSYTLYVQAQDDSGNWGDVGSISFTIDNSSPGTPSPNLSPSSDSGYSDTDNITNDNTPYITWGSVSGTYRYWYDYDDSSPDRGSTTGTGWTTPTLSNGNRTIYVQAEDVAGNRSSVGSLTITIDTSTPGTPSVDLSSSSDSGYSDTDNITNVNTPYITWGSVSGAYRYWYDYDDSSPDRGWTTFTGWTTPTLSNGNRTIYVQAEDVAGNRSSVGSLTITIDTSAPGTPSVDLSSASDSGYSSIDNITNDNTPYITWASVSGAYRYWYDYDDYGPDRGPTTSTGWTTPTLSDGNHTIYVQAEDVAGNRSSVGTLTISIDTSAPLPPTFLNPSENEYVDHADPVTLRWQPVSGAWKYQVYVREDNLPYLDDRESPELTLTEWQVSPDLTVKNWGWRVKVQDIAGNWGSYGRNGVAGDWGYFGMFITKNIDGVPDYAQNDYTQWNPGGICVATCSADIIGYWDRIESASGIKYWNLVDHGIAPLIDFLYGRIDGQGDVSAVVDFVGSRYYPGGTDTDKRDLLQEFCNTENGLNFSIDLDDWQTQGTLWEHMKQEIDANRPVMWGTEMALGGHSLPIIGYYESVSTTDAFVHVNLGGTGDDWVDWYGGDGYDAEDIVKIVPGGTPTDHYEPDNSSVEANFIDPEATYAFRQTHNFITSGDVDWIKWEAQPNRKYTVISTSLGSQASTNVTVYLDGELSTPYTLDTNGGTANLFAPTLTARTFYIKVENGNSYSGPHTNYDIEVDYDPLTLTPLTNDIGVAGSVQQSDWAFYSITLPSGVPSLEITTTNAAADVDLYVKSGDLPSTESGYYDARGYTSSGNETITLSSPDAGTYYIGVHGYAAGSFTVTATIQFSPGTVQLNSTAYSIDEDGGNIRIYVSRTGGSYGAASVNYATANGTAVAGSDYVSRSGQLTWSDGDTADKYFDVPIIDDTNPENAESFAVSLSGVSGASLGSPSSATVTINGPNDQPEGTLQFSSASYSVDEGVGSIRVYVSRTGGSYGAASIDYLTNDDSASAGSDYTARSGQLSWSDGDATDKYFDVPIIDDSEAENSESFFAILNNASGASRGTPSVTVVTINGPNDQSAGTLQFISSTYDVDEGGGSIRVYVSRSGGSSGAVSVNYSTSDGSANAGSDYTTRAGQLTWSDGDTADKYFDVPIIDDSDYEDEETFSANLSNATGASLGSPSSTNITINGPNDDIAVDNTINFDELPDGSSAPVYPEQIDDEYSAWGVAFSSGDGTTPKFVSMEVQHYDWPATGQYAFDGFAPNEIRLDFSRDVYGINAKVSTATGYTVRLIAYDALDQELTQSSGTPPKEGYSQYAGILNVLSAVPIHHVIFKPDATNVAVSIEDVTLHYLPSPIWYVDANVASSGNGKSWGDAYKTIGEALNAAVDGDEIWVAEGTYTPGSQRTDAFTLKSGVGLYGGFDGTETELSQRDWNKNETILSCDINGNDSGLINNEENCIHVVIGASDAAIDGFTITGGNANSSYPHQSGGGIYNHQSSPVIRNCSIIYNHASDWGGGIFNNDADPVIDNCIFVQNEASTGGGIHNTSSSPTIYSSLFLGNSVEDVGGGVYNYFNSSPTIVNCTFAKNNSDRYGGAVSNFVSSNPTITNCILWSNTALWGPEINNATDTNNEHPCNPIVSYSDINQSGYEGSNGNIRQDPIFVDPYGMDGQLGTKDDNLHLSYESPCVNSGTNVGTDFDDMGTFPAVTVGSANDYETVAEALDYIESFNQGGSILIAPGRHSTGQLSINGAAVSIIGADKYTTTLLSDSFGGIDVVNSSGHLEKLKLLYGTRIHNGHATIRNCIIDTGDVGIFFLGSNSTSSGVVQNCILTNNQDAIRIYRSSNPIYIFNNTISDNSFDGIYLMDTAADSIVPPVITNNVISNNGGYGIYEDYWNVDSLDADITFNDFFANLSGNYHDHTETIFNSADDINTLTDNGICEVHSNIVSDPLFIGGDPKDFHLLELSPCIDAGDPSFDYSLEPEPNGGRINIGAYGGTTEATTTPIDSDNDGLPDSLEAAYCTEVNDADSDDDGILDGNEDKNQDGIVDPDESDPCLADTDGDGIYDGTEVGLTEPQNAAATDLSYGYFVADADPGTTTLPYSMDSDGDGIPDGLEDFNHNGGIDACEPDPNALTLDILVDMDDDGDVDGADLAAYAQAFSAGTVELCPEIFSSYMGKATWWPDPDGDGIFSDGDFSGVVGDNPCAGGAVTDCDDNCLGIYNPLQGDINANGIGDVCEDLVAYYPLDGNARDLTMHANHGVASLTGVTYTSDGAVFDGVVGNIEIPSNDELNLQFYTLSAWFNSPGPRGCILAHGESDPEDIIQYSLFSSDNMSWYEEYGSDDDYRLAPLSTILTDEWYFVAVSRDTAGDFKLFINGELESSEAGTPDPILIDMPINIGARYRDGSHLEDFFTGTIDEIRIFDRALTEDEIMDLYSTGR